MRQYSFNAVDLLIMGVPIEGFENSNAIVTVGRNVPQHARQIDARGKMYAITTADHSGFFSFNLIQGSPASAALSAMAIASQNNVEMGMDGVAGREGQFLPIHATLVDRMGNSLAKGTSGFIVMQPAFTRGTGLNVENWRIEFEVVTMGRGFYTNILGNEPPGNVLP